MSFVSILKSSGETTGRTGRKRLHTSQGILLAVAALTLVGGMISSARAQQPPETPKPAPRELQSPTNPYPYANGDAQNRGRGLNDFYWGLMDANQLYNIQPLSRVPNDAANPRILQLDGWSFDPDTTGDLRRSYLNGVFTARPTLLIPAQLNNPNSAGAIQYGTADWLGVTGPSTDPSLSLGGYYRALAKPRPNVTPENYAPANKFVFNLGSGVVPNNDGHLPPGPAIGGLNVPNTVANQQIRYSIRIHLPQPAAATATPPENRISDARYTVYYYKRVNTTGNPASDFVPEHVTYLVSQTGGGEEPIVDVNGNPIFVPFFTGSTNFANLPSQTDANGVSYGYAFQGVVLDDTTENAGTNLYVLAEALELVRSVDEVYVTPIVTSPHGGRFTGLYNKATQSNTFDVPYNGTYYKTQAAPPGTQPLEPRTGPASITALANAFDPTNLLNGVEIFNAAFDFINDPNDPRYNAASASYDPTIPFESWNPSVLFRGPESLIDPRIGTNLPIRGTPIAPGLPGRPLVPVTDPYTGLPLLNQNNQPLTRQAAPVDADNNDIYRPDLTLPSNTTTNLPVPYFSHLQVIVARTEYALDPTDPAGIATIPMGAIYCIDAQTGVPIWRFPDKTYEAGNVRNPLVTSTDLVTGVTTVTPTIPGILGVDKNGDGVISDDEVFIVGQGGTTINNQGSFVTVPNGSGTGGVFASVTYAPRVKVRGNVQLPMYDKVTDGTGRRLTQIRAIRTVNGVTTNPIAPATQTAPPGRYYATATMPGGLYAPVEVGVVYVAAANGVLYTLDAYGNNDNDYSPDPNSTKNFGIFRPGTTNVLSTFSRTSVPQLVNNGENTPLKYFTRLQKEIPPTDSFGASSPVLAYQRDERDMDPNAYSPANPSAVLDPVETRQEELRLFVGNRNGVLYAMDSAADAGTQLNNAGTAVGVLPLPIKKDHYQVQIVLNNQVTTLDKSDVRFWFRTRGGGINAMPAVSQLRQDAGAGAIRLRPNAPQTAKPRFGDQNGQQAERGVFFNSLEGRLYCIDWTGPIAATTTGAGTDQPLNYTDSNGQLLSNGAIALNDDYQFHNITPVNKGAVADSKEGTVRPRWTYPNLYQDIDGSGNTFTQPPDNAVANTGFRLDSPTTPITGNNIPGQQLAQASTSLGPLTTPPVLVDFPWKDPLVANSPIVQKSYVVIQADDAVPSGEPATQSHVYLLDQVGDRVNLLTNTTLRAFGNVSRVVSHPRDWWSPDLLLGSAPPVWTYRYVYDTFNTNSTTNTLTMSLRNGPFNYNVPAVGKRQGVPGRKRVPTLFVGGIGYVYGIDFDFQTGLFLRYRPNLQNPNPNGPNPLNFTSDITPVPNYPNLAALYPSPAATVDLLNPIDPILLANGRGSLSNRRILVRATPLDGIPASVSAMTLTGGPLQNRNSDVAVAGNPIPGKPTVPLYPTNDAPNFRPDYINTADTTRFDLLDPFHDFSRFVNQDIDDPLTTTQGAFLSIPGGPLSDPANPRVNQAYQYPFILVTDVEGNLHAVNSNTEGEDRVSDPTRSYTVGWPIFGFTDQIDTQFSQIHTLHFSQQGPGGPGGVAVVTDAYFPSLDPKYLNSARALATPNDPYKYYPYGEPNTTSPTPYTTTGNTFQPTKIPAVNNDDPRPAFRPRSLSPGVAAVVGNPGTPAVLADYHTGQTGYPLDLNGLFFDKRFAGQNGAFLPGTVVTDPSHVDEADQHPNGSYFVRLRLPGYSYVGGLLTAPPAVPQNPNNQVPDGARPDTANGVQIGDDINPSAQDITWIYSGGLGGLVYAYTPAIAGQGSGFVAGTPNWFFGDNQPGTPYVDIVNAATYNAIVAAGNTGTLSDSTPAIIAAGSIARNGSKNFYEWGESVYIVVYNLIANTAPANASDYYVTGGGAVTLVFRQGAEADTESGRQSISMLAGNGQIATYNFNGHKVGVAVYKLDLNGASSTLPLTPGAFISVTALPQDVQRGDGTRGNVVQSLVNTTQGSDIWFAIANPLAVQAYMVNTEIPNSGNQELAGAAPQTAGDIQNGVGPFASAANPNTIKSQIAPKANTTALTPERAGWWYSQALTQGNRVRRRNFNRYLATGALDPTFRLVLQQANNGGDEPEYLFPVVVGAGYAKDGSAANTAIDPVKQTLRILNRSLLPNLTGVRVLANNSVLWRSWPGRVPNAPADVPATANSTALLNNNPRNTPIGMDYLGRINPLPWEIFPTDAQPWNTSAPVNVSPDYPDIPPTSSGIQVMAAGVDITKTPGTLSAAVSVDSTQNNIPVSNDSVTSAAAYDGVTPMPTLYATAAQIQVPKHQPASLVATHSITSTYNTPSPNDNPSNATPIQVGDTVGPTQLPLGIARRDLRLFNGAGGFNGARTISPFGYSTQMRVVVGPASLVAQDFQSRVTGRNPNDTFAQTVANAGGAYRDFEVGFGVPVNIGLQVGGTSNGNSPVDLGAVGASFGEQNGLLGYGGNDPIFATGFLPAPLTNTSIFGANAPYAPFFKKFVIQNTGNVNLYNLRASQKMEIPQTGSVYGSGYPFGYFGLMSSTVNPRFGILAAKADPLIPGNIMPQIVTSLDKRFDASWDAYLPTVQVTDPTTQQIVHPFGDPLASGGTSPYLAYYQQFAGKHTLHKAAPNAPDNVLPILQLPDVPNMDLRPGEPESDQPQGSNSLIGAAVPLGTPSGVYSSLNTPIPLMIFEDLDTDQNYNGIPYVTAVNNNGTLTIQPAGPLYGGSNASHPGNVRQIRSRGNNGLGEGIYRPMSRVVNAANQSTYQYQPATQNPLIVQIEVREAALTGEVVDQAIGNALSVITGRLPGIDLFPLIDPNGVDQNGATVLRAASAFTPAAYRGANGNLNIYFSRNYPTNDNVNMPSMAFAQPGNPYNLFHSHLAWNAALGTWQATAPGTPVSTVTANRGKWFTDPQIIYALDPTQTQNQNQSNTSPFVLNTAGGASLYWMNSLPGVGGQSYNQIFVQGLDVNGVPTGSPQPFLLNYDPSLQRFSPQALQVPITGGVEDVVMYYGGTLGKWSLYYNARPSAVDGTPLGTPPDVLQAGTNLEVKLPLPSAVVTATNPTPVLHPQYIFHPQRVNPANQNTTLPAAYLAENVVDVYFSGILSTSQTPEVYMVRYRVASENPFQLSSTSSENLTLLSKITGELLQRQGRDPIYNAQHVAWYQTITDNPSTLNYDDRQNLPRITIVDPVNTVEIYYDGIRTWLTQGGVRPPNPNEKVNWKYDAASGMLYQSFNRSASNDPNHTLHETLVYVNPAAGTVQFRGQGAPIIGDQVYADYLPQIYRLTSSSAGKSGTFTVQDTSPLYRISKNQITGATLPAAQYAGQVLRRLRNGAEADLADVGRVWLFYQKASQAGSPGTIAYSSRRVGFDLKTILSTAGGLGNIPETDANGNPIPQGIALSAANANGNQTVLVQSVFVTGPGYVPFDVDFVQGRIYVEPQYDGMAVQIRYTRAMDNANFTINGTLGYIAEQFPTQPVSVPNGNPASLPTNPTELTLTQAVNETQPYAFLDLFNPLGAITRTGTDMPNAATDPTLQPGKVWLLWSSPRSRVGVQNSGGVQNAAGTDLFPQGFDILWQTIAPAFESTSSPNR